MAPAPKGCNGCLASVVTRPRGRWLHKLRRAMVRQGRDRLSGNVEVDEIFVGGEKHDGKRGRGASGKALVLMVVQREEKKLGAYV